MLKRLDQPQPQPQSRSDHGRLDFQYERLVHIAQEMVPLAVAHMVGLPEAFKKMPIDVDWERCLAGDLQGYAHVLTARTKEDKRLVGYIVNQVINPFLHASAKWAFVEAIYLAEEYREGLAGYTMIKKNEKGMKLLGCKVIKLFVPVGTFESILKRLGYEVLELGAFKFL